MPQTMKAAVVHEFGKPLVIEEVPVPLPRPGQILRDGLVSPAHVPQSATPPVEVYAREPQHPIELLGRG